MRRTKLLQNFAFCVQISIEIMICALDRGMTQPCFDDVGIDSGLQQMNGCGMPEAMSGKMFGRDTGAFFSSGLEVPFHDCAYPEAGKRKSPLIDEEKIIAAVFGFAPVLFGIELQEMHGRRPQRSHPLFSAFAKNCNETVVEVEPRESGISGLGSSGAGIVEENQKSQVADSVWDIDPGLSEQSFEFLAVQGFNSLLEDPLSGDGGDAFGLALDAWVVQRDVFEERLNSGQTLVTGLGTVTAPCFGIFQMLKEIQDGFRVKIRHAQSAKRTASRLQIRYEQFERVTVALDGIGAEFPLLSQIGLEEQL